MNIKVSRIVLVVAAVVMLVGCGDPSSGASRHLPPEGEGSNGADAEVPSSGASRHLSPEREPSSGASRHLPPKGEGFEVRYAKGFEIEERPDGCSLITISGGDEILAVPEGIEYPQVPEGATAVSVPVTDIYLAASGAMDMFIKAEALENVRYSSTDADGWYLEEAKAAVESGDITYVGKYSEPDFELLIEEGCHLAVENTMIYHKPQAMDKLKELGIPVMVDMASREDDPLGRMEWIKLYGVLTGKYDEACRVFDEQVAQAGDYQDTGKTVAFFYFASDGTVSVRRTDDYIPAMIKMAGGSYVFEDLFGDNELSTENIQMEDFYTTAKDADYLIYNGMITGDYDSLDSLVAENSLLSSFKAVKEGHVYQASRNFYQSSMSIGSMINDMHLMLDDADDGYMLLKKLE